MFHVAPTTEFTL